MEFTIEELRDFQRLGTIIPPALPRFGNPVDFDYPDRGEWYYSPAVDSVIQAGRTMTTKQFIYLYQPTYEWVTDGRTNFPKQGDWIINPTTGDTFIQYPNTQLIEGTALIFTRKEV